MSVTFYGVRGPFGILSNFAPTPVRLRGRTYPTVEHAYQAAKTIDRAGHEWVAAAKTPKEAKYRGYRIEIRPDWVGVRVEIMMVLVHVKWMQHQAVRDGLARTGERHIEEDSPRDAFWGVGPDGSGRNQLGVIWMQQRARVAMATPPISWDDQAPAIPTGLCPPSGVAAAWGLESWEREYRVWATGQATRATPTILQVELDALMERWWTAYDLRLSARTPHPDLVLPDSDITERLLRGLARWPVAFGRMPTLFPLA